MLTKTDGSRLLAGLLRAKKSRKVRKLSCQPDSFAQTVDGLFFLLQNREAGPGVFRDFVSFRQFIDRPVFGFTGEKIKGHLIAAAKGLFTCV
jgi:hypothetical protein